MCKHEQKNCPRCGEGFECKVGDIAHCQCSSIHLSEAETKYISDKYTDCLCAACMIASKSEYSVLQSKLQLKIFLQGR
ncbi:MAG TPA: cysteine-rich CWC family protein [Ferruginibacter sp.]|nr:cysteine-rich CWC family protein [Ferruginibacter sp.]HPH93150.1 cysteine-rich CWC family protein [Ferruginibacter sp.]